MSNISSQERQRRADQTVRDKLAYDIDDLPYGRTYSYQLIKEGKLRALKCGRRTIITPEAWAEHLASLPDLETSAA
jgi:hypothetical protein